MDRGVFAGDRLGRSLFLGLVTLFLISTLTGCGTFILIGSLVVVASTGGGGGSTTFGPPAPTVSSVSPSSASHGGGTTVTITGSNFDSNATVTIGGTAATSVVFVSASELTAVVPHAAKGGVVDVTVTDPQGGTATLTGAFTYTTGLLVATVTALTGTQTQDIVFQFTLSEPESDLSDVTVDVDSGNGFATIPASDLVSGGTVGLTTSPSGVSHTLTFDSRVLFPEENASSVRLRVTPTDETDGTAGTPGISNTFSIVNKTPPTVQVIQPGNDSFDVVVSYTVTDPDSGSNVQVTNLQWNNLGTGQSGPMTVKTGPRSFGLGSVPFSASGTLVATVWDSLTDLGAGNNKLVSVSVSVNDGSTTATSTSGPFFISNGPLSEQTVYPTTIARTCGFAVGDVTSDTRPDFVATNAGIEPNVSGTVSIIVNRGRSFNTATVFSSPDLPSSASPVPFASPADPVNPFLNATTHATECAILDTNGDGALDLLVADSYFGPLTGESLLSNTALVLGQAFADAEAMPSLGFFRPIAHQATLRALQTNGLPDVTHGTWETSQAVIGTGQKAPFIPLLGNQLDDPPNPSFPLPAGPHYSNQGWFTQFLLAANLDAPTSQGGASTDLVILQGIASLGSAALAGDARGCVVIRQVDPTTNQLGPTFYLDPTDMGVIPTHCAVADVLSSSRLVLEAALGIPPALGAPVGSPDIIVANTGDDSLTFYFQLVPASWPAGPPFFVSAPTYTSFRLPLTPILQEILPAGITVQPGDTIGVAIGDLNGDGANDFVVVGQIFPLAITFLYDTDPTATNSLLPKTQGLLPFRIGTVIQLPQLECGRPAIGNVSGQGRNDLVIPSAITNETLLYENTGNAPGTGSPTPVFNLVRFASDQQPVQAAAVDLNGDGRLDVAVANLESIDISVYYQTTPGTLDERFVPVPAGQSPELIDAGDLDGNGGVEVVCPMSGDNSVWIYQRDPIAGLAVRSKNSTAIGLPALNASEPFQCAIGDLNGDGKLDVLASMQVVLTSSGVTGGWVGILSGGLGSIIEAANFTSGGLSVSAGDLNKDGLADVALTSPFGSANQLAVFLSQGKALGYNIVTRSLNSPRQVKIIDIDGDSTLR